MKRGLVIGYYDRGNFGDEAFKDAMPLLFPGSSLTFVCSDDLEAVEGTDYDHVIVGGGDVINDYFEEKIGPFLSTFDGPKIGVGIGVPFESCMDERHLGYFDHIFTRNRRDVRAIQKIIGSDRAHYLPEITMSLPTKNKVSNEPHHKRAGFFLVGTIMKHRDVSADIIRLVNLVGKSHKITLYSCDAEDTVFSEIVKFSVDRNVDIVSTPLTTEDMKQVMSELDLAVCMRFHALVFSILGGCRSMSISSTRKTRVLAEQAGLAKYQYEITLDDYGTPVSSSFFGMKMVLERTLSSTTIFDKMLKYRTECAYLLDTLQVDNICKSFEETVDSLVDSGDYDSAARVISKNILGHPDSEFVWGMREKLAASKDVHKTVKEICDYLRNKKKTSDSSVSSGGDPASLPIYVDLNEYTSYEGAHRGGWYNVCRDLAALSDKTEHGIIMDMYVDRTFHWVRGYKKAEGTIPYTSPWAGFIHHTFDVTYSPYNNVNLFLNDDFRRSLRECRALFTLSPSLTSQVKTYLTNLGFSVPVITLTHPVEEPPVKFSMKRYDLNPLKKLVNVGSWLRNPFSIYTVESTQELKKCVLMGKEMKDHLPPSDFRLLPIEDYVAPIGTTGTSATGDHPCRDHPCRDHPCRDPSILPKWIKYLMEWMRLLGIETMKYSDGVVYVDYSMVEELNEYLQKAIGEVEELPYLNNKEYDVLLSQNVVFLDMIDAAAVNTIIECIVRNTPVVVNRNRGTVDLLGKDYPLFYDNLHEVSHLLHRKNVEKAFRYLEKQPKERYTESHFIESLARVLQRLQLDQ